MVSRRPSFQFYPGDWLNDIAVRASSPAARALWIDMLCAMNQGEPYGYLTLKGRPFTTGQLSKLAGMPEKKTKTLLKELAENGVFGTTDTGVIFSRRLISDEVERRAWAERQKKTRDSHALVTPESRLSSSSPSPSPSLSSPNSLTTKGEDVNNGDPPFFLNLKAHVEETWKRKKHAPYLFRPTEDKLLKAVINAHNAWGAMALWDCYLDSKDEYARRNGYNVTEFFRQLSRLVDDPQWRKLSREHEKKLLPPLESLGVLSLIDGAESAQ